jgi:hypothetical protein
VQKKSGNQVQEAGGGSAVQGQMEIFGPFVMIINDYILKK